MADGFSPGHEVRERVAVGTWTAGSGTGQKISAPQQLRQLSGAEETFRDRRRDARICPEPELSECGTVGVRDYRRSVRAAYEQAG
jgi:hypothetical protein